MNGFFSDSSIRYSYGAPNQQYVALRLGRVLAESLTAFRQVSFVFQAVPLAAKPQMFGAKSESQRLSARSAAKPQMFGAKSESQRRSARTFFEKLEIKSLLPIHNSDDFS